MLHIIIFIYLILVLCNRCLLLSFVMLLLILACVAPTLHDVIDLSQQLWTLHGQDDDGVEINVPATVPGNVYTDLQAAGVLQGDFYYRFNDVELYLNELNCRLCLLPTAW